MMTEDIKVGIEISLQKDFPVITETLNRVGIKNSHKKCFYPSCYCIEKDDKYFLVHFKELFLLDGKESSFDELDELRRNTIAFLLQKWNLITIEEKVDKILQERIDVLKKDEMNDYRIIQKYRFIRTINV